MEAAPVFLPHLSLEGACVTWVAQAQTNLLPVVEGNGKR